MSDLSRRLNGLERVWPKPVNLEPDEAVMRRLVQRLAAERGQTVEAVLAEAEAGARRAAAAGVVTLHDHIRYVAVERGIDPEEAWAEVGRMFAAEGVTL